MDPWIIMLLFYSILDVKLICSHIGNKNSYSQLYLCWCLGVKINVVFYWFMCVGIFKTTSTERLIVVGAFVILCHFIKSCIRPFQKWKYHLDGWLSITLWLSFWEERVNLNVHAVNK